MVSATIGSLMKSKEPYSVTGVIDYEAGEVQTKKTTGDYEGGLFAKAQEGLGKMDFLKLLTTQLQYQDPLSPMENTEFVAQLAQFSQLEATSGMEKSMFDMLSVFQDSIDLQTFNSQSTTNASSVSLIGKEVRLRQNTFEWNGGSTPMTFKAHLGEKTSGVVQIVDGDGEVIRRINLENKDDTNAVTFTWDGKDENGQKVLADRYNLIIEGQERDNSLYCFAEDYVTGIRFDARGTMIRVDGIELPISDILEVKTPTITSGDGNIAIGLTMTQALGMVGNNVKTTVDKISYSTPKSKEEVGDKVVFNIDLAGGTSVKILIRDENGNIVHREEIKQSGEVELDKSNYGSDSSKFTIEIDSSSNRNAFFYDSGTITGVLNQNGVPMLKVGAKVLDPSKIKEITAVAKDDRNAA